MKNSSQECNLKPELTTRVFLYNVINFTCYGQENSIRSTQLG